MIAERNSLKSLSWLQPNPCIVAWKWKTWRPSLWLTSQVQLSTLCTAELFEMSSVREVVTLMTSESESQIFSNLATSFPKILVVDSVVDSEELI